MMNNHLTPKLSLNFTAPPLDGRITFARSGATATRTNPSGLIEAVAADVARFDYNPVSLACQGILIEETRVNRCLFSEDFRNTADAGSSRPWSYTAASLTANAVVSPNGTQDADNLIENSANAAHFINQQRTGLIAGGTYTWSVFAKAAGRNWIFLTEGNNVNATAFFNLASGVVGDVSGTGSPSATIRNFGNGWYRCSLICTIISTVHNCQVRMSTGNAISSYQGNGSSGVSLYGGQLEEGAFATSYIPTTTAAVTRNADVATITGTNFSGFWRAGRGSALVRARPDTVSGTRPWVQFDDATANNIIALRGNTTNPELYIRSGGSDQAQIDAGTIAANASYRLAGAWATDDCAASVNSGTPVLDGIATIPTSTQARLGSDGTNYLNGYLESVEYYGDRILNSTLQVISSTAGYKSIISPVILDVIIS